MTKMIFIIAIVSISLPNFLFAESASFKGLGDLPGGEFRSDAFGVSADGSTVVGYSVSDSGVETFLWKNGIMTGLGGSDGDAWAVSADGSVIAGTYNLEAYRWEAGTMSMLGDLPGGGFYSNAYGISDDGSIVVGTGTSDSGTEAVRWENGMVISLGDLPGGSFHSVATSASFNGSVIVGFSGSETGLEAFRWENGVMTGLGYFADASSHWSQAYDVSADGSVIVGYCAAEFGDEPFRWENGIMSPLGDLAGDNFRGHAYGVSADGSVIVGKKHSIPVYGTSEAFIWNFDRGMVTIKDMLVNDFGLNLSGWTLSEAIDISADGRTIVGLGINPDGYNEAWVATIPEPTTILLLSLGSLVFRRRF